jgi:hypothetical protein
VDPPEKACCSFGYLIKKEPHHTNIVEHDLLNFSLKGPLNPYTGGQVGLDRLISSICGVQ